MLTYILFNTLIYGSIAFVLSAYFGYGKYLNVAMGAYMILGAYTVITIINDGWSRVSLAIILGMILVYRFINHVILHYFTNDKQRDLFGLIFTLGGSVLIENVITMIYGPVPTSIQLWSFSAGRLLLILIAINILVLYIFDISFRGKVRKGIYTNTGSVRSLGIRVNAMLQALFLILLPGVVTLGVMIANQGTMRASDNLFYIIKGIGIMIMVGIDKKEYIYLGALVYVILEYLMFIQRGLPIDYKEALILIVILIVLLCKPEGLLSIRSRKI